MTVIYVRVVIFLDGAGMNILKSKIALWKRNRQDAPAAVTMDTFQSTSDDAVTDEDVLAEAAKICAGNVEVDAPILADNLTKTFVDVSSGLEIKAVRGVSFEVPLSQVMCRPLLVIAITLSRSRSSAVLRLHRS
jgi:hypothetical protein